MAVTITAAQTSDAGAPQAGVTIAGLSAVTGCNITLTTSWDGGLTWNAVRGGTVTGALGSTFIRDYIPALNVPIRYQAVVTGGSTATVATTDFTIASTPWIQDPLAPKSAVPLYADMSSGHVALTVGSLDGGTWGQHADIASVIGTDLPAVSLGMRQKIAGLPLILTYDVAAEGGLLRSMLMKAGQLVVRGLPASGLLDPVAHVIATDANESRYPFGQVTEWTLNVRQVQPLTMRIIVPWWTYDQVLQLVTDQLGAGVTYAAVLAAMTPGKTYTQWLANPGTP